MTIRSKITMITLPLIITPLILTLLTGVLSSRNGITNVATEFLTFKSRVLTNYLENQWLLLTNHDLQDNPDYLQVSQSSVKGYAETLIENRNEIIFVMKPDASLVLQTGQITFLQEDLVLLRDQILLQGPGWTDFYLEDMEYISDITYFKPFDWYVINGVERHFFYDTVSLILYRSLLIFLISLVVSVILLLVFARYLTNPVHHIVNVIRDIIRTNDLSKKVELRYTDEIGQLGHYFNIMTQELEIANLQIKNYALKAVISKRKEMKIRNIFQKYVPKSVIDQFYEEPESMLEGDSRILGILFSDIRSFTSFSEKLPPYEVVESLNKYFEYMVDIIMKHNGIVDKYIGDAIMAFFGAPVHSSNDALATTVAALEMVEKLTDFNTWQVRNGRQPFQTGIGINYGVVTVGNIGTEKKMEYTAIGDMVNLASRLEGLTKIYRVPLLVSESVHKKIHEELLCRTVDQVIVKGKTDPSRIYTVAKNLSDRELDAWNLHEEGIEDYFNRNFIDARDHFAEVFSLLPGDYCSHLFIRRCEEYIASPPDNNWTGSILMESK